VVARRLLRTDRATTAALAPHTRADMTAGLGTIDDSRLASRLYERGLVVKGPLDEHVTRPRLSRVSPATQAVGPVEDEWLRDNLVAIAQLAESLDRGSFELAMRIVPIDWWAAQLPDRLSTAENLRT
jgi:hypothetical protein